MRLAFVALPVALGLGAAAVVVLPEKRPTADAPAVAAPQGTARQEMRRVKALGQLGPGRGTLLVGLEAPEGAVLTAGSPISVEARGEHLAFPKRIRTSLDPERLPLRIPIDVTDGAIGPARVKLAFYWCDADKEASCRPERVELVVDLDLSGDAAGGEAFVSYRASRG